MHLDLNRNGLYRNTALALAMLIILGFAGQAWAAPSSSNDLGALAGNLQDSLEGFAKLMIAIAYLAGIGFVLASIFKFKQHKDNPTQIPLGTALALLVIGIILVFLPSIFAPAGNSLFGENKGTAGGFKAEGLKEIPGAGGK